jgi:hypothetical protein
MGDIEVGGDSSVMWKVNADNVRKNQPGGPPQSNPSGPKGHHQEGVDEVDAGQYFEISLEVPASVTDKNNLATDLQSAAQAVAVTPAGSGARVSLLLPIEDNNENQIQITWNSSLVNVLGNITGGGPKKKGPRAKKKGSRPKNKGTQRSKKKARR